MPESGRSFRLSRRPDYRGHVRAAGKVGLGAAILQGVTAPTELQAASVWAGEHRKVPRNRFATAGLWRISTPGSPNTHSPAISDIPIDMS